MGPSGLSGVESVRSAPQMASDMVGLGPVGGILSPRMVRAWFVRSFDNPVNGVVDGLVTGFLHCGTAPGSAVFESFPAKPQFNISALTDHNLHSFGL